MNSLAIILGYNVTIGLPEMIIFLLAAILLGFSIHFYWSGKKSVPGIRNTMTLDNSKISEEDLSRLQLYEQIEKHEMSEAVSYTHLRAHETPEHLVCRLLL